MGGGGHRAASVREVEQGLKAVVEGFELGSYRYDKWRTTNKEEKAAPTAGKE